MTTFKFLALSLLIATTGLYSSVNTAEASEDKVVAGYNREFMLELLHRNKDKSLQEISAETGIPINVFRDFITRGTVIKKIDEIYNNTPEANRTLNNITETLNRELGKTHTKKFVARWLKVLGYNFVDDKVDDKKDVNNSYKEVISNNFKEDISNEEIVNYIKQPGKTVTDAAKYFKQYGKSAREIREIYAKSNENRRLVYEAASALDNGGGLPVNGAVESVINVIKSVYHKNMNGNIVKENLEKMDFIPMDV